MILMLSNREKIAEMVQSDLAKEGFQVEMVTEYPDAALRLEQDVQFEIILLDFEYDKQDIFEICQNLKLQNKHRFLPIVGILSKDQFLDQLMAFGQVTPGYLGVITGEMLTRESSLNFFGRPDISGLLVEQVNDGSPAELAGIAAGDVMTAIDGTAISSVIGAIDQINRKAPGQMVDLSIYRQGENLVIPVQLGTGTSQYRIPEIPAN